MDSWFSLQGLGPAASPLFSGLTVSGNMAWGVRTVAANSTLTTTTAGTTLVNATTAPVTITLPTAASSAGKIYVVKKIDSSANNVTLSGNGSETIDGSNTRALSTQWTSLMVQSNGSAWFVIGDR